MNRCQKMADAGIDIVFRDILLVAGLYLSGAYVAMFDAPEVLSGWGHFLWPQGAVGGARYLQGIGTGYAVTRIPYAFLALSRWLGSFRTRQGCQD